ncbi:MAG: FAD-binding oxidoreductase [Cyanobacteria bacterium SBLK]|nr:FAD-binding oxidoreductase [Cyanobacteria bacterium SBLK]
MEREIAAALDALNGVEWVSREKLETDWQKQLHHLNLSAIDAVLPKSIEQLSQIVTLAAQKHWTIIPCGNGSKLSWGGLARVADLLISTQKLDRIVDHAVGDLTVTVEAGVKLADLQAALQPSQQFLPLDPAYPENATLGGIVATADSGSWRHRYGGVRDLLLGLSFVRGDGKIAKAGGRVVKNVAGYDLMKLFSGSYGSLGIISQLTFRTYPVPETSGTILLTGESEKIASVSQSLLNSSLAPVRVALLSGGLLQALEVEGEMGLAVQFASISESVREQQDKFVSLGERGGLNALDDTERGALGDREIWPRVRDLTRMRDDTDEMIVKIGILPSRSVALLQELDQISPRKSYGSIHVGSGLGYIRFRGENRLETLKKLRETCQLSKGFLTILEASIAIKKEIEPWGYPGNALALMKQIQQKFDREEIFSSGRFVGGI